MSTKTKSMLFMLFTVILLAVSIFTAAVGWGPTGTGAAKNIKLGLDLSGGVSITYQAKEDNPSTEDMDDTIYKLQKRVESYSTEAAVYKEGNNRINIEIPGVTDANAILEDLGKPGSLKFTLEDGTVVVDGTHVESAQAGTQKDNLGNTEFVVLLDFDKEGSEAFAKATGEHVGEQINIVYDDEVVSAPVVKSRIEGGQASITGMNGQEDAETLASFIRIGSLSLELEEIRSNVVGAHLGEEALKTSLAAGAAGILLVILLLVVVYKVPGLVAGIVLILYTALDIVLLNAFDMTLTLPGIAGIILSIGMAVDANVIIYSRIREEIANGMSVRTAIRSGFQKSMSAILDGNITTMIAGIVLNFMGSGSVKGFAQTLMLGIVLSMITSLVISRIIMTSLYELGLSDEKWYGKARECKLLHIVEKRKMFVGIAAAAALSGFIAMGINTFNGKEALNLSMDFRGGTSTSITFNDDMPLSEIEKEVNPLFADITGDKEIQVQKVAGSSSVVFKTRTLTRDERDSLEKAVTEKFDIPKENIESETVTAAVSREMQRDAIVAVIVATVLMLLYIWIRFLDIRFAASAVIALIHDVLVVFACYCISRISVGATFIACMLTIVGYSINATIVIFDRIRENLKSGRKASLADTVDTSISQTMTRSIYTTATTFITIAMLFVFGVHSIREFALPLMTGILAGCFSSVCLTGSIWYMLKKTGRKS